MRSHQLLYRAYNWLNERSLFFDWLSLRAEEIGDVCAQAMIGQDQNHVNLSLRRNGLLMQVLS